ncbi:hypothetical protein M0812_06611 [Anaeramoeba flamelloides]|uniref:Uncharacterized protein n=1 Tax=Anaeramoeba flamelloides TaxID=1746091 RepID=A0AAV8AC71_9EUKA|nr:hypothetical protein M0812_06611 [Anaeramoeba flamelloides]
MMNNTFSNSQQQNTFEPFFRFPNDDDESTNNYECEVIEQMATSERSLTTDSEESNCLCSKFQFSGIVSEDNSEEERSTEIFSLFFDDPKSRKEEHKQQQFFTKAIPMNNPQKKKRSVPIPINYHSPRTLTLSSISSESEEDSLSENESPLTFIQPHRYLQVIQTQNERELRKSFNVPLKRVPSWRI